jgi:hypothetical protein
LFRNCSAAVTNLSVYTDLHRYRHRQQAAGGWLSGCAAAAPSCRAWFEWGGDSRRLGLV